MYTPPHNRQEDPQAVAAFMRAFPFATLVTSGEGGMVASHIPLNLSESCDSLVITGHIAKANPQWQQLASGAEAMAIFSEPHSYVSPSNYEAGSAVPTWNYVAVHAYGAPAIIEDREGKLAVLSATIAATEPGYQHTLDALPREFVDAKLKGIVAFEIGIARVDARWKLSQDRQPVERERISLALRLSGDPSAQRLAEFMESPVAEPAR
ncbi:MAG: FMN-binding negative transcriptional regulator [bacterium]